MKIQNKKEIELTVEDLENMVCGILMKEMNLNGSMNFNWRVINKPIKSGMYDSMDHHVFDGVKIVVSE